MKILYKNKIVLFLFILTFFKPICFQYYSNLLIVDKIYNIFKIFASILVITQRFIEKFPKVNIKKQYFAIFIFGLWGVITTVLNDGYLSRALIDFGTIYAVYILVSKAVSYDAEVFITQMEKALLLLVSLQLISEIIYPSGLPADLYTNNSSNALYFMTLDNGTASLTILAVTFIFLKDRYCKVKKNQQVTLRLMICLVTAILSGSTTAVFSTLLVILVPAFIKLLNKHSTFDRPITWVLSYLVIFIFVIIGGYNSIFNTIFTTLTGKQGFTGRVFLWDKALNLITKSPVIGYGRQTQNYISAWGGNFSSHNVILEMLLQGGIIAVILWILCIIVSTKNVRLSNDRYLIRVLLSAMFIILIALMMEITVFSVYLFTILAMLNECLVVEKLSSRERRI